MTATAVAPPAYEELAKRVDEAVRAVAALDGPARAAAEELQAAVEAVHKAGLVTIVRRLKADDATKPALFELVDDPVVHLLLALHGIVRPDPTALAERALASVRPQLASHGGDVALDHVADGVAYVRLSGACNGCSMSAVTLRNLVETAVVEEVESITRVEVLPNEPSPTMIPLDALRIGPSPEQEGWVRAGAASAVTEGAVHPMRLASASGTAVEVLLVNIEQRLSAFRNECAHEGLPLDSALLDPANGTLTCPWHGFCYDAGSGECLSAPGAALEQLPLRVDSGDVWVRVD